MNISDYRISTENIPLTAAEASALISESKVEIPEGCGFFAALNINGESEFFSERTGIPQSVYNLAVEKCGYKAKLVLTLENGEVMTVFKGMDD